jgi:hypothetical protein
MKTENFIGISILLLILIFMIIYSPYIKNDCKKLNLNEKNIFGCNGTFYGGYNCYDMGNSMDIYFSPKKNDEISGDITFFIKCYSDSNDCYVINKFKEIDFR